MPLLNRQRRSMSSSNSKTPKLNKGAIIGITIGGIYVVVLICLLVVCIRRRQRKNQKLLLDQEMSKTEPPKPAYDFGALFDSPPPSRGRITSEQYSRSPTRSPGHTRALSDGTITRGVFSTPFWMFDGSYEESSSGSLHQFSSESTLGAVMQPATAPTMELLVRVDISVSQTDAESQEANFWPGQSMAQVRPVTRSPSPPSSIDTQHQEGSAFLPPIPMHPLMRNDSIERIVSSVFEKGRGGRENDEPELVRVGALGKARKAKIMHGTNTKSLSALSDRIVGIMRRSKTGGTDDLEKGNTVPT